MALRAECISEGLLREGLKYLSYRIFPFKEASKLLKPKDPKATESLRCGENPCSMHPHLRSQKPPLRGVGYHRRSAARPT